MKQTVFLLTQTLPTEQNAPQEHPDLQKESYTELRTTAAFFKYKWHTAKHPQNTILQNTKKQNM